MKISILVGTMTGTAQLCAQEMELALDDGDNRVETLLMDQLDSSVFSREGVFLICTSTYGQGDVPDNAKTLYDDLRAKRPDLSGVRYGVRSEEHTSELQSRLHLVCRLLLEKKKTNTQPTPIWR